MGSAEILAFAKLAETQMRLQARAVLGLAPAVVPPPVGFRSVCPVVVLRTSPPWRSGSATVCLVAILSSSLLCPPAVASDARPWREISAERQ